MNSVFSATSPGPTGLFAANSRRSTERGARDEGSNKEVNKLLTAAVVSKAFCRLLLTNPAQALEDGYNLVVGLTVVAAGTSLPELATQFNSRNGNGVGQTPLPPLMQV